jgi:hypothetical protein
MSGRGNTLGQIQLSVRQATDSCDHGEDAPSRVAFRRVLAPCRYATDRENDAWYIIGHTETLDVGMNDRGDWACFPHDPRKLSSAGALPLSRLLSLEDRIPQTDKVAPIKVKSKHAVLLLRRTKSHQKTTHRLRYHRFLQLQSPDGRTMSSITLFYNPNLIYSRAKFPGPSFFTSEAKRFSLVVYTFRHGSVQ